MIIRSLKRRRPGHGPALALSVAVAVVATTVPASPAAAEDKELDLNISLQIEDPAAIDELLAEHDLRIVDALVPSRGLYVLTPAGPVEKSDQVKKLAKELHKDPDVSWAEVEAVVGRADDDRDGRARDGCAAAVVRVVHGDSATGPTTNDGDPDDNNNDEDSDPAADTDGTAATPPLFPATTAPATTTPASATRAALRVAVRDTRGPGPVAKRRRGGRRTTRHKGGGDGTGGCEDGGDKGGERDAMVKDGNVGGDGKTVKDGKGGKVGKVGKVSKVGNAGGAPGGQARRRQGRRRR